MSRPAAVGSRVAARAAVLLRPGVAHWMVLGCGLFLLVFGLIMVLSASSVESFSQTGSPFATVARQAGFALAGLPLAYLATRVPVRWWRRLAWPSLLVALALQAIVFTSKGIDINGNRAWFKIGPVTVQPAEAVKLAMVLWVAHILVLKQRLLHRLPHLLVPLVFGVGLPLGLVLAGRDVGSALVVIAIVTAMVFAAGVRLRHLLAAGAGVGLMLAFLVLDQQHRRDRVQAWLGGDCTGDYHTTCWQLVHGQWALAQGGWWGMGLGGGREKWAWLPEAHNDFIFAVIGEELGLPGSLTVLALFAGLAVGAVAIARSTRKPFVAVATAGLLAWLVGQALLNMGVVLGLLPVTGVPLPLVSSGGSSLVTAMIAVGMLVSFGRDAEADELAERRTRTAVPGRLTAGAGVTAAGRPVPRPTAKGPRAVPPPRPGRRVPAGRAG